MSGVYNAPNVHVTGAILHVRIRMHDVLHRLTPEFHDSKNIDERTIAKG